MSPGGQRRDIAESFRAEENGRYHGMVFKVGLEGCQLIKQSKSLRFNPSVFCDAKNPLDLLCSAVQISVDGCGVQSGHQSG
jgi:hypothetical protein